MSYKNRDTGTVGVYFDFRIKNLFRFDHHFPFFFGRSVIHKDVNLRNDVKRNLFGELFLRFVNRLVHINAARLIKQFVHGFFAGTGNGLIRRYDNALDLECFVQRRQRNDHLNGGAVRIGNNVFLFIIGDGFGIDFGNDQRNVGIHAPLGRIIDNDATGRRHFGSVLFRNGSARGHQSDINAFKIERCQIAYF